MHLDADDLLAQFQQDYPHEYEVARLRLLCHRQHLEIERLTKLVPQPSDSYGRAFPSDNLEVTRHDLTVPG